VKAGVELGGPGLDVAEVWAEHAQRLRRIIWLEIRDHNQVEDVLQETFVRVCRAAKAFDASRGELAPWLNTMARRACLDLKKRWRKDLVSGHAADREPATTRNPEDELFAHERSRVIARAFGTLNGRHRRLLQAHISGVPYDEIAEQERLTADAVKSVMARARNHFRASYTEMAEKSGLLGAAVALRGWLVRARARLDQAGAMANEHFASVMGASVAAGMLAIAATPLAHAPVPVSSVQTSPAAIKAVTVNATHEAGSAIAAASATTGGTHHQTTPPSVEPAPTRSPSLGVRAQKTAISEEDNVPIGDKNFGSSRNLNIHCDAPNLATATACPVLTAVPLSP
jgi:RNA polymerase sigma factor (sigma-70 family)